MKKFLIVMLVSFLCFGATNAKVTDWPPGKEVAKFTCDKHTHYILKNAEEKSVIAGISHATPAVEFVLPGERPPGDCILLNYSLYNSLSEQSFASASFYNYYKQPDKANSNITLFSYGLINLCSASFVI